jgi:hypothetical protein
MSPGDVSLGELMPEGLEEVEAVEHPLPPLGEKQDGKEQALGAGLPDRD